MSSNKNSSSEQTNPKVQQRKFWFTKSVRFRLAGVYIILFGGTLIVFSMLLYRGFVQTHQREFDAALYNHAIDVAEAINVDMFGDLSLRAEVLSEEEKLFPFSIGQAFLDIRTVKGHLLARSQSLDGNELPFNKKMLGELANRMAVWQNVNLSYLPQLAGETDTQYRMITYLIQRPRGQDLLLQIAVPLTFLIRERRGLITFFLLSVPGVLLIALITGLYLSKRALSPVHQITAIAADISAQNLAERVPVPPANDELRELALTFNDLLDRLQKAFAVQERFVADAAHQLKTPLSIIRGELDILISRPRETKEMMEFLTSASQEIDQLTHLTEDLLILARVDAGTASLAMSHARVDEIAGEVISRLERLARPRNIKLRLNFVPSGEFDFETTGDPELLACMFQNLVENAIKYSDDNKTIDVEVGNHQDGFLQILVRDQGCGISETQLPHVFERFYRAEGKGRGRPSGSGLGLTIAHRIAEVHGGSIAVRSKLGQGSEFTVRIKKV